MPGSQLYRAAQAQAAALQGELARAHAQAADLQRAHAAAAAREGALQLQARRPARRPCIRPLRRALPGLCRRRSAGRQPPLCSLPHPEPARSA